ncbi:phospholipase A [Aquimarina sp. RZ0]|uniref:phospholipase A n=1 Tax=Aquimarina sp. RZ0 TaxID=2607730 RepID=UPI0011F2F13F|nr:phospholipase A [Aquimarina sp. RZ0]KAA1243460.1 phospholipase A [Aquimarina sp. RZ0]
MKILSLIILLFLTCSASFGQALIQNPGKSLSQRWQINDTSTKLFKIVPYKPVYFLLANYTTRINNQPRSNNPINSADESSAFSNTELKFQLSFKTKALKNLLGKRIGGDIWIAYTQSSRWQLYSANISRPFRETNYEPEFMLIFPTSYTILGLDGVFAGIGINHQSNGRSNPLSRSWNRIILQVGWESPSWSIVLKPWWRLQEDTVEDNNPEIESYVGRIELLSAYTKGRHDISLVLRHSLRMGDNNRANIKLDYAIKILDNLQIHAQLFHGHGESLIDYNHKQTTFGIGLSLIQWR